MVDGRRSYTTVRREGWTRGPRRDSASRAGSRLSTHEHEQHERARDQAGVEEDGRRPRAGGVAQHAADRRRQHGAGLADQVVHAEGRAVLGGIGDVGDHRVGDRLHRV
jgi:hypothetical protein